MESNPHSQSLELILINQREEEGKEAKEGGEELGISGIVVTHQITQAAGESGDKRSRGEGMRVEALGDVRESVEGRDAYRRAGSY